MKTTTPDPHSQVPAAGPSRLTLLWRYRAFAALVLAGMILAVVLLVQTIGTYRFAASDLVPREAARQAAREVGSLERAARAAGLTEPTQLVPLLRELHESAGERLAWVMVLDGALDPQAQVDGPAQSSFVAADIQRAFATGEGPSIAKEVSGHPVLVFLRPLRLGPAGRRIGVTTGVPEQSGAQPGQIRRPILAEVAIDRDAISAEFGGLRARMAVSIFAALGLLASLAVITARFPRYVRGRELLAEVQAASSVQRDLLPSSITDVPGLEVAALSRPASEVGGDFYDVLRIDEHRVGFVVGDVSGKGMAAGLLMAMVSGALHASDLGTAGSWPRWAERLNMLLLDRTAPNRFVTLFVALLDRREGTMTYINAGHPPPAVFRRKPDGHVDIERLETGGPAMGVVANATFACGRTSIQADDMVVLYSDGISEAEDAEGREFGDRRLLHRVAAQVTRPAQALCREVLAEVRAFGAGPARDDQTLLMVRRSEPALASGGTYA